MIFYAYIGMFVAVIIISLVLLWREFCNDGEVNEEDCDPRDYF